MDDTHRRRLSYRAWHRGTREADYMVGGFFDRHQAAWDAETIAWFERVLDAQDVDIMAWAFGRSDPPPEHGGPWITALRRLDYIDIPR